MNIARPAAFSSSSAAPGAGPAGFVAELANDPLGIVAGYLPQSDRLVMRQAGDAVRQVVDATLRCLRLTGRQACDLFARPDAFGHLGELHLTRCNDAGLVALADVLRHGARPAFDLVLDRETGVEIGTAGLRAIAPLNLSGITLRAQAVPPEAAMALAESRASVSIALRHYSDGHSNLYWISQIPTLTSLTAGTHHLCAASIDALRSHPALTRLSVAAMSVEALHKMAGHPRLQSLSVSDVRDVSDVSAGTAQAFAALADSATLTSLFIGRVTRAEDIATLSRSRTLSALTLHVGEGAAAGFPALATLPALAHLALRGRGAPVVVAARDIAAVCGRPLKSLQLGVMMLDVAAFAHVAATHASSLSMEDGRALTDAEAALLAANPRLSQLSLGIAMVSEAGALLLARAPGLQRLKVSCSSFAPVASKRRITEVWTGAGKPLAALRVEVYENHGNEGVMEPPPWA